MSTENALIEVKENCPRCGSDKVEKILPNERGKDRKCGRCHVLWDHNDPKKSWSMIGL
jgi:transposase-like protein